MLYSFHVFSTKRTQQCLQQNTSNLFELGLAQQYKLPFILSKVTLKVLSNIQHFVGDTKEHCSNVNVWLEAYLSFLHFALEFK